MFPSSGHNCSNHSNDNPITFCNLDDNRNKDLVQSNHGIPGACIGPIASSSFLVVFFFPCLIRRSSRIESSLLVAPAGNEGRSQKCILVSLSCSFFLADCRGYSMLCYSFFGMIAIVVRSSQSRRTNTKLQPVSGTASTALAVTYAGSPTA